MQPVFIRRGQSQERASTESRENPNQAGGHNPLLNGRACLPHDAIPGTRENRYESGVPFGIVDDKREHEPVQPEHGLERRIIDSDMARAHDHDPRDSSLGRVEGKDAPACVFLADGRPALVNRADAAESVSRCRAKDSWGRFHGPGQCRTGIRRSGDPTIGDVILSIT